jgi:S-adenosylmethionine synthetase
MSQITLFTSESVSAGHPDKLCDRISDGILDACLEQDPTARVAVEAAIKSHRLFLFGEIATTARIDPVAIAKQAIREAGYDDPAWGLDVDRLKVTTEITRQSAEIASGVGVDDSGAGDQGLMFGYATDETPEFMPLPLSLAHAMLQRHDALRHTPEGAGLGPDAKAQVTVARQDGGIVGITDAVLSSQHAQDLSLEALRLLLREQILVPVLGAWWSNDIRLHLNPAGSFHLGGPAVDAGLTGRKIIVDTYGGAARHGGGAFSGKDPTKVDRSAAYAARQIARDVVTRGWSQRCEVQLAYAIGQSRPVSIAFETESGPTPDLLQRYAREGLDLYALCAPAVIIDRLGLRRPIYAQTAAFGHFGRRGLPWEAPLIADPARRAI